MSDSVRAGTVVVGDISANGPCPWTTDQTARIVAVNSVTPAPACRSGPLPRAETAAARPAAPGSTPRAAAAAREHAAEVGRTPSRSGRADRAASAMRVQDRIRTHRGRPSGDADDSGNDRQLREDVAEQALAPDRPVRLADEPRDGSSVEKARDDGRQPAPRRRSSTDAAACRSAVARRSTTRWCQPRHGLGAVGQRTGQAPGVSGQPVGSSTNSVPAGPAAAPATTGAAARAGAPP